MNSLKKFISLFLTFICLCSLFIVSVNAESSDSFNRVNKAGGEISTIVSRECYEAVFNITGASLGLNNALEGISDVYVSDNGKIYLLASGISKIIVLSKDYKFIKEILISDDNGSSVNISGAKGIYVEKDGTMYIADALNGAVMKCDANGKILLSLEQPDSEIIPEDFYYQPTRILRTADDYMYVLSEGCFYGALVYSPEYQFEGFLGANTVSATVLDAFSYIIESFTSNDTKKSSSIKNLPYSFLDFSLDSNGYIVTCTGSTDTATNGTGQIKIINQAGANILYRTDTNGDASSSDSFNFLEKTVLKKNNKAVTQNIISVDINDEGYIYALDQTYGLIYIFDSDCNLITGFGGLSKEGGKLGLFTKPISISLNGSDLMVVDSENKSVTVFQMTEFGKKFMTANTLYINGNYTESTDMWKEILREDKGNQLAYRALAMSAYVEEDYKESLSLAKKGYDYSIYDMAYQRILLDFISKYFVLIALAFVAVVAGIVWLAVALKRKKFAIQGNVKFKTAFSSVAHPFRAFDEVKNYGRGSVIIATVLLLLFFVGSVLKETASGFMFLEQSPVEYNILYSLAKSVGLVILWVVSNWLISTLMSGRGKPFEIYIGTLYALIPYIIFLFVSLVLSWFLPLSAVGFIGGLETVVLIYTFFILSVAMMQIHDYNFFKFLIVSVISVFAMIFVVFIIFMIVILIQQLYNLIYAIVNELVFR